MGYVVAPAPLLARLAALRSTIDTMGDPAMEDAIAELVEDGEVQRHVRRVRRRYQARRDALADCLRRDLPGRRLLRRARGRRRLLGADPRRNRLSTSGRDAPSQRGVFFSPGRWFAFDERPLPFLRLGFACLTEDEIAEAVRRLALARPRARKGARGRGDILPRD